ncbi:PREDICTED: probable carboxylesterase 9 [Ipomoea nil]|uniref:probable carboxylesterase 9 n=1 Tax=Ipomoea nil TaxID=35883 RepID=UPI000900DCED|nr:PREDICTED: probable carboxylesterase 9 [Ipomoea nil]
MQASSSKFDPYEHLKVVLNDDGTLTRLVALPTTPATGESATGHEVLSKDVTLNGQKKTWMRIYKPAQIAASEKLPIIIYFRNGSWIGFNVAVSILHENCNKLAAQVPAIVVSVDYRNAPENRLPAQYEDAMDAVNWVKNQNRGGDTWLKNHGDFSRCYLYGTSCGANIAYHAALRALDENPDGMTIAGVILNQPLFGGKKRTRSELKMATDQYFPLPVIDVLWELALPPGADRDHRYCNPIKDGASKAKLAKLGKFLVIGFGGDTLIDRQQDFVQMLVMSGAKVEARFDDVGFHGIEMIDPRRSAAIVSFVKDFV